jgi:hypothetical protein
LWPTEYKGVADLSRSAGFEKCPQFYINFGDVVQQPFQEYVVGLYNMVSGDTLLLGLRFQFVNLIYKIQVFRVMGFILRITVLALKRFITTHHNFLSQRIGSSAELLSDYRKL